MGFAAVALSVGVVALLLLSSIGGSASTARRRDRPVGSIPAVEPPRACLGKREPRSPLPTRDHRVLSPPRVRPSRAPVIVSVAP